MPDGDKFYRRLSGTGRGWGTVYRMSCNNSPFAHLKDKAMKAVADNLRRISPDSVETAISILHKSIEQEKWRQRSFLTPVVDSYLQLERDIRGSRFDGDFNLVKILERSIEKVFIDNRYSSISITKEEINEKLGQTLAKEIIDSRFLSRVRESIMETQNRSISEQIKWEKELCRELMEPAGKIIKNFLNGKQLKKFRAPVVRRIDRNATSNILNRPLSALPPM